MPELMVVVPATFTVTPVAIELVPEASSVLPRARVLPDVPRDPPERVVALLIVALPTRAAPDETITLPEPPSVPFRVKVPEETVVVPATFTVDEAATLLVPVVVRLLLRVSVLPAEPMVAPLRVTFPPTVPLPPRVVPAPAVTLPPSALLILRVTEFPKVTVSVSAEASPPRTRLPVPPIVIPVAVPLPEVADQFPLIVVVLFTSRRSSPVVLAALKNALPLPVKVVSEPDRVGADTPLLRPPMESAFAKVRLPEAFRAPELNWKVVAPPSELSAETIIVPPSVGVAA
jgi:hypothetical protein